MRAWMSSACGAAALVASMWASAAQSAPASLADALADIHSWEQRHGRIPRSVPEAGGLVWVTFPKVENGSGFPARVIAVVP